MIDKSTRLTKLDLVRYYESIAPWMVPHLKGRPCSLVRGPSGVGRQLFFQKHVDKGGIKGIVELDASLWPGHAPLLEVPTACAIAAAAQMNVIEFHTWNSTTANMEKPDRIVFDLDPGEGVPWKAVKEGAELMRSLLRELELDAWLKTSGGKGLHIVVPLARRHAWDTVSKFSEAAVQHLAKIIPNRFVAKSGPRNRIGKIFVDFLRNRHGATTAAAFSARARPGLGVSMPISWERLDEVKSSIQWTIKNAREYVSLEKVDPWAGYWTCKQSLNSGIKALRMPKEKPGRGE